MTPTKKTIKYYSKNIYGNDLDYVFDPADAKAISMLTGRKTFTAQHRAAIEGLSGGLVTFEQVIQPALRLSESNNNPTDN